MKPLCQYGFPCVHELYDDDGDLLCGYPFSKVDLPKTEEDMEKTLQNWLKNWRVLNDFS